MLVKAYGAYAADKPLESLEITRRATGAHDVQINAAYERMLKGDVKYRFVIDNATLAG